MFKNYIKIAFRNLFKYKLDSIISIGGLSIGTACCILLVLFVHFEWSFDDFHVQSDRVYRVVTTVKGDAGDTGYIASSPYQMGPELKATYPEFREFVRIHKAEVELKRGEQYQTQQVLFAGPAFFEMFSFELLRGSQQSVLDEPGNIILTESKARELFGGDEALGEVMTFRLYEDDRVYRVAGIVADPPANSSFTFGMIMPYENYPLTLSPVFRKILPERWVFIAGETFVFLNESADRSALEIKMDGFAKQHYKEGPERQIMLQPLSEIYLNPEIESRITTASSLVYSWILVGIAVVVLVIACINFMSLTLSRSSIRANEIGIRKVAGAFRRQIAQQFMGEAFITCFLAFIFGAILAELALPYLQNIVGKQVPFAMFEGYDLWFYLGGLIVISALMTGLYPALVMARKTISESLKGSRSAERVPSFVRGLMVVQFTLSIIFVSAAFIMHRQMDYVLEKDLGFEEENVVLIRTGDTQKGQKIFKDFEPEATRLADVRSISATFGAYGTANMSYTTKPEENRSVEIGVEVADADFLETLQIELLEGRGFSEERPSDLKTGALVNQAFVESMGWKQALGKGIPPADLPPEQQGPGSLFHTLLGGKMVIGVVKDFHYESLHKRLRPLVLVNNSSLGNGVATIWVKIGGGQVRETLAELEEIWNRVALAEPFNYSFLDDIIQRQYEKEQRWRAVVDIASFIAIALACFGLLGLAALSAKRRAKEIGIRKILGATVSNIVHLLFRDFLKPVLLGFLIAIPITWYAMNQWLIDFAYRIEIGPGIFVIQGVQHSDRPGYRQLAVGARCPGQSGGEFEKRMISINHSQL